MKYKIIGSPRVSSKKQAENSHALEQKLARIKFTGATEVYQDFESGYKSKIPPNL